MRRHSNSSHIQLSKCTAVQRGAIGLRYVCLPSVAVGCKMHDELVLLCKLACASSQSSRLCSHRRKFDRHKKPDATGEIGTILRSTPSY